MEVKTLSQNDVTHIWCRTPFLSISLFLSASLNTHWYNRVKLNGVYHAKFERSHLNVFLRSPKFLLNLVCMEIYELHACPLEFMPHSQKATNGQKAWHWSLDRLTFFSPHESKHFFSKEEQYVYILKKKKKFNSFSKTIWTWASHEINGSGTGILSGTKHTTGT